MKEIEGITREEMLRELERELAKPLLPPSDWKQRALANLERARRILRETRWDEGDCRVRLRAFKRQRGVLPAERRGPSRRTTPGEPLPRGGTHQASFTPAATLLSRPSASPTPHPRQ